MILTGGSFLSLFFKLAAKLGLTGFEEVAVEVAVELAITILRLEVPVLDAITKFELETEVFERDWATAAPELLLDICP